jgi:hypothetical protein
LASNIGPHDEVGDVGLVLERDEHDALGRAGLLADEHDAGELDPAPVLDVRKLASQGSSCARFSSSRRKASGCARSESPGAIILDHLRTLAHRRERDLGLDRLGAQLAVALVGGGEQRSACVAEPLHLPHSPARRLSASEPNPSASPIRSSAPASDIGAALDLLDAPYRAVGAGADDRGGIGIGRSRTMRRPSRTAL